MENKEINIEEFKKELRCSAVCFKYNKKNGEYREAVGTLDSEIIGEENMPKGTGYETPDNVIKYYDIVSKGWRSFLVENLIEWIK